MPIRRNMKLQTVIIFTAFLLFALLAISFFSKQPAHPSSPASSSPPSQSPQKSSDYTFSNDTFSYTLDRQVTLPRLQRIALSTLNLSTNAANATNETKDTFEVYHTSFSSRPLLNTPARIAALLFIPKAAANITNHSFPAIVFLPGGGGTKESRAYIAAFFARRGYIAMVIDQRGIGETSGQYLDPQTDYRIFAQGNEPMQHIAVYDALRSFDILRIHPAVDEKRIILAGESMGARYALIAAALDNDIAGTIAISAAGFNIPLAPEQQGNSYLRSTDPDNYIARIAPRPVAMLHDPNDTVIPFADAQHTFEKARNPKKFFTYAGCNHGYCPAMNRSLDEALRFVESAER